MKKRSASELRQLFLDFFAQRDHAIVKSASLVPNNDPTLMFTNAGMVQFKDVFVGAESRAYTRATTSQKCMRVSGKHNDLEEVGRTARHHTFFEMLGNFSFGDYFKDAAIEMAWEFLVDEIGLPPERLWITVFGGEDGIEADTGAREIWKRVTGFKDDRIIDMGKKDNFWSMGDTGPCGPCTEIHFDLRDDISTVPVDDDFDSGALTEIWNNVFMQFERKASGEMVPLPKPSVDTGMGLERLATIVQGVDSNYHADLFAGILEAISGAAGRPYGKSDSEDDVSMRVIADHCRATAFLVADGVQPSNEGRGYVMRRIMRRAIRHGKRLGMEELFFHKACAAVVTEMGEAYPQLKEASTLIEKVCELEETNFRRTLDTGLIIVENAIEKLQADGKSEIPGETVFKLYDTYGFPKDLTEVIAEEKKMTIDSTGFDAAMKAARILSQGAHVVDAAGDDTFKAVKEKVGAINFIGYPHEDVPPTEREGEWRLRDADGVTYLEVKTTVKALVQNGKPVDSANDGMVEVVLEPTPFYGESGGQVGDRGVIVTTDSLLEVIDTKKPLEEFTMARARILRGEIKSGTTVWAGYDPRVRKLTRAHHSATHLLHGSLRGTLGDHVKQAGSLVDPDHLRFDFSHFESPTPEQLRAIEDDANRRVQADHEVKTEVLSFDDAKERGAIAMFGEKYGDVVRVLTMGESVEFCGGTHAKRTGDIEMILLTRDEAVASGVRRIEAEVGEAARRRTQNTRRTLHVAAEMLNGEADAGAAGEDTILLAIAKAMRQGREFASKLPSGDVAGGWDGAVLVPELPDGFGLTHARLIRDIWQGLVQLVNARANDAEAVVDKLLERNPTVGEGSILSAFASRVAANRENERRLAKAESSALGSRVGDLLETATDVGGVKVLTASLDGVDGKSLRGLADQLRDRLGSGVLALVGNAGGKAAMLVAVTGDLTGRFKAGAMVKELAPIIGGRGGGKPELAQAGGTQPEKAAEMFERLRQMIAG